MEMPGTRSRGAGKTPARAAAVDGSGGNFLADQSGGESADEIELTGQQANMEN